MSKFSVGDKVYYCRWSVLNQAYPTTVVGVFPKKWYQLHRRYLVEYPDFPAIAIEKDLIKR